MAFADACIYDNDSMERIKYAYSHGHMIGSHTWHHYDLATLSWDQSMTFFVLFLRLPVLNHEPSPR